MARILGHNSADSKLFWINCKPYFSNKYGKADIDIVFNENGDLILKNEEKLLMITFAQLLVTLICIIGKTKLLLYQTLLIKLITLSRILKNIQAFVISKNIEVLVNEFSFRPVYVEEARKIIGDLKTNRVVGGEIPTKILKECEFTSGVLTNCVNKSIETDYFPDSLKLANVAPVFKKEDPLDKSNYRPVSFSPLLSKVYEKVIYEKVINYLIIPTAF